MATSNEMTATIEDDDSFWDQLTDAAGSFDSTALREALEVEKQKPLSAGEEKNTTVVEANKKMVSGTVEEMLTPDFWKDTTSEQKNPYSMFYYL